MTKLTEEFIRNCNEPQFRLWRDEEKLPASATTRLRESKGRRYRSMTFKVFPDQYEDIRRALDDIRQKGATTDTQALLGAFMVYQESR